MKDSVSDLQREASRLVDWLEERPRTFAAPVVVKIGRRLYAGATYATTRAVDAGCRAHDEGERWHTTRGMYLLGELPYAYRRRRTTSFVLRTGSKPWYVAGWWQGEGTNEYHRFGRMFLLHRDDMGVCVDDDGNPYPQVKMGLVG